jgi:hypothetical protein
MMVMNVIYEMEPDNIPVFVVTSIDVCDKQNVRPSVRHDSDAEDLFNDNNNSGDEQTSVKYVYRSSITPAKRPCDKQSGEARGPSDLNVGANTRQRDSPLFAMMQQTRARFKYAMRMCKRQVTKQRFWRSATAGNKMNTVRVAMVDGCTGDSDIADMWRKY